MMQKLISYKLVVFVPESQLEKVSSAIFNAGAGVIGNYDHCAFLSPGIGTYRPLKGAKPFKGKSGKLEKTKEFRLEVVVGSKIIKKVILAMKKAHPYEEVAYDVYPLANI
jgi:hypothetical protein